MEHRDNLSETKQVEIYCGIEDEELYLFIYLFIQWHDCMLINNLNDSTDREPLKCGNSSTIAQ